MNAKELKRAKARLDHGIAACLASMLFACGQVAEPPIEDTPPQDVAVAEAAILNGIQGSDDSMVAIQDPQGGQCSGVLVRNDRVITARHCTTTDGQVYGPSLGGTYTVNNAAGQSVNATVLLRKNDQDVALLSLSSPLPLDSRTSGAFREFYPLNASTLLGATHTCMGYGDNDCFTGNGGGQVSRYAFLEVAEVNAAPSSGPWMPGMLRYATSAQGQRMRPGDSGGSCKAWYNGRDVWMGIHSLSHDCLVPIGTGSSYDVGPHTFVGWMQDTIDDNWSDGFNNGGNIRPCGDDTGDYESCPASPFSGGSSNWGIYNNRLRENSNHYGNTGGIVREGAKLFHSSTVIGDGYAEVHVQSSDDDAAGLFLRAADGTHYYRFSVDEQRNYARIVRRDGGTWTTIAETTFNADWDSPGHTLLFYAIGPYFYAFVDSQFILFGSDFSYRYTSGRVGVYDYGLEWARFNNLQALPL